MGSAIIVLKSIMLSRLKAHPTKDFCMRRTNKVVRISYSGGLLGLIFGSARGKLEKASAGAQLKKGNTLLSVLVLLSVSSNAYGMEICQMSDTLVWGIKTGFDIDPKEVEEFSAPYDVFVKNDVLYLPERIEGNREALTPIEFNERGTAERKTEYEDTLWFKVSDVEFRILDREFGYIWNSNLTCSNEG